MQDNMKYRQSLVAIGGSLVGRWRTTTASNQGVAMRQPAHAWLGRLLLGGLVTLALSAVAIANAEDKIIHVNCDDGKTIKQALHKADPGETIRVTGTCTERVTITTDWITLDGQGTAVLDGGGGDPIEFSGVVTIDGARGVTLTGLTIQNGPGEGILGQRAATFAVRKATVQDNALTGIAVTGGSTADLTDSIIQRNGGGSSTSVGLDIYTGSTVILRGTIVITQNPGSGVNVFGKSMLELRGANVQLTDNGGAGLVIGGGSNMATFLFPSSPESKLMANNHFVAGIIVLDATIELFGSPVTISATNNGIGIWLIQNSYITNASPFPGAAFLLEGNSVGVQLEGGSGAQIVGGPLTVRNNGTGLLADGAGALTLVSIPPNPSAITNNGTDVGLKFGTRATFGGVTIGTIVCDATVLSRGSTVCP
jgi:hypothetical protein